MAMMFGDDFEPLACSDLPYMPIWLDPARNLFAIVDRIDYGFASQWSWTPIGSKSGTRRIEKIYARRTLNIESRTVASGRRRTVNIWLHKEILLRAKGPPHLKSATIGDHINGNSLDCRRDNLRWSTASENRRNLFGSVSHQLRLGFREVQVRHLKG